MKLSLLSTSSSGGAGIAALRLHNSFIAQNIDSTIYFRHLSSQKEKASVRVLPDKQSTSRPERHLSSVLNEVESFYIRQNRTPVSSTIFDLGLADSFDIGEIPYILDSDIINFHWTSGFAGTLSIETLTSQGKAIALTMHDEWFYTGGCHYTAGCNRYKVECNDQCPQIQSDPLSLISHSFSRKISSLASARPLIITPSKWLAKRARQSRIMSNLNVVSIPNPFPVSEFDYNLFSKSNCVEALLAGKRSTDFYILLAAASLDDKRKGFDLSADILKELFASLDHVERDRIKILLLGKASQTLLDAIPFKAIQLGSLPNTQDLSFVYSKADLFLNTTREDNYPSVVIESQLCGTPVISFDIGGISEQINNDSGKLIQFGDKRATVNALIHVFRGKISFGSRQTIRNAVLNIHSPEVVASQYIDKFQTHITEMQSQRTRKLFDSITIPKTTYAPVAIEIGDNHRLSLDVGPISGIIHRYRQELSSVKSAICSYLEFEKLYDATTVEFSTLCTFGWSGVEPGGRWTQDKDAHLLLPLDKKKLLEKSNSTFELILELTARSYGQKQRVICSVDGASKPFDVFSASRKVLLNLAVPSNLSSYIDVRFHIPHARVERGGTRKLGIFLESFSVNVHPL